MTVGAVRLGTLLTVAQDAAPKTLQYLDADLMREEKKENYLGDFISYLYSLFHFTVRGEIQLHSVCHINKVIIFSYIDKKVFLLWYQ